MGRVYFYGNYDIDMQIEYEDIIEHLGNFRTKIGDELIKQCPLCGDKSQDNLHYNPKKNILWCFADESHSKQILSEIYKKKNEQMKKENAEIPNYIKYQKDYIIYQLVCNAILLSDIDSFNIYYESGDIARLWESEKVAEEFNKIIHSDKPERARTYLESRRGINKPTIEKTGLGIDFEKYGKWVIPIYDMQATLRGFEYRGLDFDKKRIWREKGITRCLAKIYGSDNCKKVAIVEGFLDGYVLAQFVKDTLILSCSNGASSLIHCIPEIQFNKYEEIQLILDNDDAGDEATKKIISQYPFISDNREFLKASEVKDISDWYTHKFMVK